MAQLKKRKEDIRMAVLLTQEEFIRRAKGIHGDKYDYSKVEYVNSETKVTLICPVHGEFLVRPSDHIHSKIGCVKCSGRYRNTKSEFIEKARKIYGDKYDYSNVEYVNSKTKVCIICHEKSVLGEEHGEFWQRPNDHLSGYSCPKCGKNYVPTTEEWIMMAKWIHGSRYDYSKVNYIDAHKKVCIICPIHGEFWQTPSNHLNGCNCPDCNSDSKSKMEENIHEILRQHNIEHERQKTFEWLKHERNLFLDFYLPRYNIAIEVQGEQHFRPIKKFGGEQFYAKQRKRDDAKRTLCNEHGVRLFYVTKKNYDINEIIDYISTVNK